MVDLNIWHTALVLVIMILVVFLLKTLNLGERFKVSQEVRRARLLEIKRSETSILEEQLRQQQKQLKNEEANKGS